MTQTREEIKISLEAARVNAKLSQQEIAEVLGVGRMTIGRWENGKNFPTTQQFVEMCKIYKIHSDYIFLPIKST